MLRNPRGGGREDSQRAWQRFYRFRGQPNWNQTGLPWKHRGTRKNNLDNRSCEKRPECVDNRREDSRICIAGRIVRQQQAPGRRACRSVGRICGPSVQFPIGDDWGGIHSRGLGWAPPLCGRFAKPRQPGRNPGHYRQYRPCAGCPRTEAEIALPAAIPHSAQRGLPGAAPFRLRGGVCCAPVQPRGSACYTHRESSPAQPARTLYDRQQLWTRQRWVQRGVRGGCAPVPLRPCGKP